jgi:hypothetical protein
LTALSFAIVEGSVTIRVSPPGSKVRSGEPGRSLRGSTVDELEQPLPCVRVGVLSLGVEGDVTGFAPPAPAFRHVVGGAAPPPEVLLDEKAGAARPHQRHGTSRGSSFSRFQNLQPTTHEHSGKRAVVPQEFFTHEIGADRTREP